MSEVKTTKISSAYHWSLSHWLNTNYFSTYLSEYCEVSSTSTMCTTSWQKRLQHSEMPRMTQARWCNDEPGWASLQWRLRPQKLGQPWSRHGNLFSYATFIGRGPPDLRTWFSKQHKDAIWKKREVYSPWSQLWDEPLRTHRTSAARTCAREHPVKAPLCSHT